MLSNLINSFTVVSNSIQNLKSLISNLNNFVDNGLTNYSFINFENFVNQNKTIFSIMLQDNQNQNLDYEQKYIDLKYDYENLKENYKIKESLFNLLLNYQKFDSNNYIKNMEEKHKEKNK